MSWYSQDRCLDCYWQNDRIHRRCPRCESSYKQNREYHEVLSDFVRAAAMVATAGYQPTQKTLNRLRDAYVELQQAESKELNSCQTGQSSQTTANE